MKSKRIIIIALFVLLFGPRLALPKYNVSHLVLGSNLQDLGVMHMASVCILEGEVPYDDFEYGYGPYTAYFNALLFKLFGIKISVAQAAIILTVMIITVTIYLLGRQFLPMSRAFLAALVVHLMLIPHTLIPYANIYSIATGLIGLLLICKYFRTNQRRYVFLAGLLCGVSLGLKINAGLFTSAGIAMAVMVADGRYSSLRDETSGKFSILDLRPIIIAVLIGCTFFLVWRDLNAKYFLLFVLPVLIASSATLRVQGRFKGRTSYPEKNRRRFEISLMTLTAGALVGITPGLCVYLFMADSSNFFQNSVGLAMDLGNYYAAHYPEMERTTAYLLACSIGFWLTARAAKKRWPTRRLWPLTLFAMAIYVWLLHGYFHLTASLSLLDLVYNIFYFLGPVVSLVTGVIILWNCEPAPQGSRGKSILEDKSAIAMILAYQAFSFLVAYPSSDFLHISWSFPTTMILLAFLLCKGQAYIVDTWSQASGGRILGRTIGASLTLSLPILLILAFSFPLLRAFYRFSPDMLHWERKEYVKLNNERAGIYEFFDSAVQVETVDRYIQANTGNDEFIFEFPTTFFYFYSQRRIPTRWLYFFTGVHSDKQHLIIEDLKNARPALAIFYDNPFDDLFSYSKAKNDYPHLIDYIENNYQVQCRLGYFVMMKRKPSSGN